MIHRVGLMGFPLLGLIVSVGMMLGIASAPRHLFAEAQFLQQYEIEDNQCFLAAKNGQTIYSMEKKEFLVTNSLPIVLIYFEGSTKFRYHIECLSITDNSPPDLPDHLQSTCASAGGILSLLQESPDGPLLVADISYYLANPLQTVSFAGLNAAVEGQRTLITWQPLTSNASLPCYPRYVTMLYNLGKDEPPSSPMAAYIVIGVIAGVFGIILIALLAYLLHRHMNTFQMRGEMMGSQKDPQAPFGPGDEDPEAVRLAAQQKNQILMLTDAATARSYPPLESIEVEPGVFVSKRTELYSNDPSTRHYVADPHGRTVPPNPNIVPRSEGEIFANADQGGDASAAFADINYTTVVPSVIHGRDSRRYYGDDFSSIRQFGNTGGNQSAVIEVHVPRTTYDVSQTRDAPLSREVDQGTVVPMRIVSVPLRKHWYERVSEAYRGEQLSMEGQQASVATQSAASNPHQLYPYSHEDGANGNRPSRI